MIICSQGGKNSEIMLSVDKSLLRCLKGEGFPNKDSFSRFYNIENMKMLFKISQSTYKIMKKNLKVWSKYWPRLNSESLKKYQKYFVDILATNQDIAGGHIQNIFLKSEVFYKKMGPDMLHNEPYFYSMVKTSYSKLIPLIPECLGIASYEMTNKYMKRERHLSLAQSNPKEIKRIQKLRESGIKYKKRKKMKYIEEVQHRNQCTREEFKLVQKKIRDFKESSNPLEGEFCLYII